MCLDGYSALYLNQAVHASIFNQSFSVLLLFDAKLEAEREWACFLLASTTPHSDHSSRNVQHRLPSSILFTVRTNEKKNRWMRVLPLGSYCPAARRVLAISMAMVIRPTPPGTGVMAEHLGATWS